MTLEDPLSRDEWLGGSQSSRMLCTTFLLACVYRICGCDDYAGVTTMIWKGSTCKRRRLNLLESLLTTPLVPEEVFVSLEADSPVLPNGSSELACGFGRRLAAVVARVQVVVDPVRWCDATRVLSWPVFVGMVWEVDSSKMER